MSTIKLTCDQAIFTSVRTPMGEGYRIIAASRGLRPDEKQVITRFSPSHDALCLLQDEDASGSDGPLAAGFYDLPRGRFCVAVSCAAGAEHTGRGGQRIYTHNVVFARELFPDCGYNPFAVVRSMIEAGLASPELKPPPVLPELELTVQPWPPGTTDAAFGTVLSPAWGRAILNDLLQDESVIVNLPGNWLPVAEALLLGVPGPARQSISLGAGMKFSVGRFHRLSLSHDEPGVIKSRIAGRPVKYIDPSTDAAPQTPPTEWLALVDRHWQRDDFDGLARRTSRAFANTAPESRERVARIYNQTDSASETDTPTLLSAAQTYLTRARIEEETDLVEELLNAVQRTLVGRLSQTPWAQVEPDWRTICTLWRRSDGGRRFAGPLVQKALAVAAADHPITAGEMAFDLVRGGPPEGLTHADTRPIDTVLERLANWAQGAADAELDRLQDLCRRWKTARPTCPIVERIHQRCTSASVH
jgi:hypothetical protein